MILLWTCITWLNIVATAISMTNSFTTALSWVYASKKLQSDADLTLDKAMQMARGDETIRKQQALLRNDFQQDKSEQGEGKSDLDYVHSRLGGSHEVLLLNNRIPTSARGVARVLPTVDNNAEKWKRWCTLRT